MKFKKILCMFLSVCLCLSATACEKAKESSSDSENSTTVTARTEKKQDKTTRVKIQVNNSYKRVIDGKGATLTVYTNRSDRVKDRELIKLTEPFEKANNCKVDYITLDKYDQSIRTKMDTGYFGDVIFMPPDISKDSLSKYFSPLGDYDEFSRKYRWADQRMTSDGTVYGLATGGSVTGLLYNKKVWKNSGYSEEEGNLPKTPDEFLKALKSIKKQNPECTPILADLPDTWVVSKWNDWAVSASGDPAYKQRLLDEKTDILSSDSYYYKVNKLMFDIFSDKDLVEKEAERTDWWDLSKPMLANGEISCMVLGSWAIRQFQDNADDNTIEDIGYMPIPFTAENGKQYSELCPDYFLGICKNSQNKELAKVFVEWFIKESGYSESETMVSTDISKDLPEELSWNGKVEFFEEARASDGYDGIFNKIYNQAYKFSDTLPKLSKMDKTDKLFSSSTDFNTYTQIIARAAFNKTSAGNFEKICENANKKWSAVRDEILHNAGLTNDY